MIRPEAEVVMEGSRWIMEALGAEEGRGEVKGGPRWSRGRGWRFRH